MRDLAAIATGLAVGLVLFLIIGAGTNWFGLVAQRPMAKYAKETERQVYVNSVAHQQGANSGVGIDCANMRNASNATVDRHAYAAMVVQDAAAFGGDGGLSADTRACVRDANDLLATVIPSN